MRILMYYMLVFSFVNCAFALEGDAEKEQVKAAITAHGNELRQCYNENQKSLKGAEGTMFIQYEVNDQGALVKTQMDTKKSKLKNEVLFNCVAAKAKAWFFPASPKGTTVVVLHPFTFKKIKD